jgi:hypothetical protein
MSASGLLPVIRAASGSLISLGIGTDLRSQLFGVPRTTYPSIRVADRSTFIRR